MKLYREYFEILIGVKIAYYAFEMFNYINYFKDDDKGQINALLSEYAERYYI